VTERGRLRAVIAAFAVFALLFAYLSRPARGGAWLRELQLQERYARVGGASLRYVRLGAGPPLLLIHGLGSSIFTWRDLLRPLAETHDVVAVDLPGFGGSSRPTDLSFAVLAGALEGLLVSLELEGVTLVGNSLGGAVALAATASRPELVSRLVLIDAAGFGGPEAVPRVVRWAASGPGGLLARSGAVRRVLVWGTLLQLFHDRDRVTAERVDEYLAPLERPGTVQSLRALLEAPASEWRRLEDVLGSVSAPTLIVWGEQDAWLPVAHAARFGSAIPGSRVVVLPGCGHLPQEERPADVLELIRGFAAGQ
jgi:pimeloyl-ACP methyl ester carboxylesterase